MAEEKDSWVWKYFKLNEQITENGRIKTVTCCAPCIKGTCTKNLKYSGSTSGMHYHLRSSEHSSDPQIRACISKESAVT